MLIRGLLLLVLALACSGRSPKPTTPPEPCPQPCKCQPNYVQCTSLNFDRFPMSVYNLKIVAPEPIDLGEEVFKKLDLQTLNFLHFENTTISSIHPKAFSELRGLTTLSFVNSKLPSLENVDTTSISQTLRKLLLTGTSFSGFDSLSLQGLEELDMSHCNITEIPSKFFSNMPYLSYINLSNNKIANFDATIFNKIPNLIEIQLSHNQITQIPDALFTNETELSTINLSNNPISRVEVKSPSGLEELVLKNCQISAFIGGENLEMLASLDLSRNTIADLPINTFSKMQYLEYLDLSNNELESLDSRLFYNNSKLLKITLDNNDLKTIPKFSTIDGHFQTIYLSCNNCLLEDLAEDVFEVFPGMVTLSLSNNNLKDIKEKLFQKVPSLIELDLSYNKISKLKPQTFVKNSQLTVLVLAGNSLSKMDSHLFAKNGVLKKLDVSNCQLTRLWTHPAIDLPSIKVLNAAHNKIAKLTKKDLEVTKKIDVLDLTNVQLDCTDELRETIKWLTGHDVAPSASLRKTHEEMGVAVFEELGGQVDWEDLAKDNCPDSYYDEEYDDLDKVEKEDEIKGGVKDVVKGDVEGAVIGGKKDLDKDAEMDKDMVIDMDKGVEDGQNDKTKKLELDDSAIESQTSEYVEDDDEEDAYDEIDEKLWKALTGANTLDPRTKYPYLWPTLVFLLTSLVVLIISAFVILMVLRRRNNGPGRRITLSHIQILPWSTGPNIKKHSGSVYRPLSEERIEPQSRMFSQYEQLPTSTPGVHAT